MELLGQPLIAGKPTPSSSTKTFIATNPATNAPLSPPFQESTTDQVDAACRLADQAFAQTRRSTPQQRATLLRTIADEILALGDTLIARTIEETGLPRPRIEGERGRTVGQLKLFADLVEEGSWVDATIDRAQPDRQPLPKPDLRRMLVPLGPVAVFGASNFPLAFSVAGGDTASALAAGCPVVCKGHPAHPGTSELVARAIARAIEKCNFPAGTFSLLQGAGTDYALALVRHPAIKAVGFTGSLRGGRALYDEAARRPDPIPVYAEMGSTNPVFVLPGALRERAEKIGEGLATSVTMGVGQFCTKPGLVFLPKGDEGQRLVQKAADAMGTFKGTMLTRGILDNYGRGISKLRSKSALLQTVQGGGEMNDEPACNAWASMYEVDASAFNADPELGEEVFGPVTVVVNASSREELLAAARNLHGHLTATLHGTDADLKDYADLIDLLQTKVGRLIFNGWPTGVEVTHAMVHGGPYPATTDPRTTSVGTAAIYRWARPVCYQNFPQASLPEELKDTNPRQIWRRVDGKMTRD